MKISAYLRDYQLDEDFANWQCDDKVLSFNDLPIGAMFSVLDLEEGTLSGWGYNEYFNKKTAGVFRKENETQMVALASRCPSRYMTVDSSRANVGVCVRILSLS